MTVIIAYNREKSLCHIVMVANLLDDNKPKRHLKSGFALFQPSLILFSSILICQLLKKFPGVEIEMTISKFRKRKRKFLCHVHILHNTDRA